MEKNIEIKEYDLKNFKFYNKGITIFKQYRNLPVHKYINTTDLLVLNEDAFGKYCLNDPNNIRNHIRINEQHVFFINEGLECSYPMDKLYNAFYNRFPNDFSGEFKDLNKSLNDAGINTENFPDIWKENNWLNKKLNNLNSHDLLNFNCDINQEKIISFYIIVEKAKKNKFVKEISDFANLFGYDMTSIQIFKLKFKDQLKNEKYVLFNVQLEVKYSEKIQNLNKYLYHVSPFRYLDKIKKYGIVPKSKSNKFNYSDRIYLFNNMPKSIILDYGLKKTIETAKLKRLENDNKFCIFKINSDKLKKSDFWINGKLVFFEDPDFNLNNNQNAIFTYQNIPKQFIDNKILICTIDVDNNKIIDQKTCIIYL